MCPDLALVQIYLLSIRVQYVDARFHSVHVIPSISLKSHNVAVEGWPDHCIFTVEPRVKLRSDEYSPTLPNGGG